MKNSNIISYIVLIGSTKIYKWDTRDCLYILVGNSISNIDSSRNEIVELIEDFELFKVELFIDC